MLIEVDFNSDEAIYIQLCNQIILGIAMSDIQEGDMNHAPWQMLKVTDLRITASVRDRFYSAPTHTHQDSEVSFP